MISSDGSDGWRKCGGKNKNGRVNKKKEGQEIMEVQ